MNRPEHTLYAIALSLLSSPGSNRVWDAVGLPSPMEAYDCCTESGGESTQQFIADIYDAHPLKAAEEIILACLSKSIDIIHYWDPRYPAILKEIARPPIVLYAAGYIPSETRIAVVGTRAADQVSREIADRLSGELAERGLTVVSGMAMGIDRHAHLGAMKAGGATIGVLAGGIDITYPYRNRDLYRMILESHNSCLVSEYPPGTFALNWTFSRRNRIISGLSAGTIVVMAGEKSGALITARYALEQNREVFACPGHTFDKGYYGCHSLIRQGAHIVGSAEDVLRELGCALNLPDTKKETVVPAHESIKNGSPVESGPGPVGKLILQLLNDGESDIDTLIRRADTETGTVMEALVDLEISGYINRKGNSIVPCRSRNHSG